MKKLLHIIATPRREGSRTLKVSKVFLETFKAAHPDWMVEDLDLSEERLPELTVKRIDGKYALLSGKELSGETQEAWQEIVKYIDNFLSADGYLISAPMWNFSIPYTLKHYIDVILQPRYLFKYTPNGAEGLVKNKKMVAITSRGGDYSAPQMRKFDLLEPYLRATFGLAGITDITFINAQPMDALGSEMRSRRIEEAQAVARKAAEIF